MPEPGALDELAVRCGTDKSSRGHGYMGAYQTYLEPYRARPSVLIEIGVGSGGSLRMWREWMPRARVYGIDIAPEVAARDAHVFIGDQADEGFLLGVLAATGAPDVVIDDGGHMSSQMIASFRTLFPRLRAGGLYVVEDTHCFHSPTYDDRERGASAFDFFSGLARDGCLVVRPDSGDPVDVVPRVMQLLGERIGESMNDRGYKVLDPHVRMIQGDGIDAESLGRILEAVKRAGYSTDNIAFGSGGGLLQKLNRDTQRFAFKCSAVQVGGEWRDVFKRPATDATKNSKAGRLELYRTSEGGYLTADVDSWALRGKAEPVLRTVFEDGELLVDQTFAEVRARAELPAPEVAAA